MGRGGGVDRAERVVRGEAREARLAECGDQPRFEDAAAVGDVWLQQGRRPELSDDLPGTPTW